MSAWESVFAARVVGDKAAGTRRGGLACRVTHPAARPLPSADNLVGFCFPLGIAYEREKPWQVTEEFSFTLTGGDGSRLHGFCRKTNDPTYQSKEPGKRFPQVLCLISQHPWTTFFYKVLEVLDQLLKGEGTAETLAPTAPAAVFMASLQQQIPSPPVLGAVIRVGLPPLPGSPPPDWTDLRMRRALPGMDQRDLFLHADATAVELEVPPDLGNSPANAGISLARLLFFLTPRQATTLLASLLLERHVILVSKSADTVSAAVHAAAALLYPLRWQHIFLPLLPLSLKDYLAAPMPYLVGIQAECLPMLKGMAMEEVVMMDLDTLGRCQPELGSMRDDAWLLPFAEELTEAFDFVRDHIRNPGEFHTTPKASEMVQSFLLKLLWRYRQHVLPEGALPPPPAATPAVLPSARSNGRSKGSSSRVGSRELVDDAIRAHSFAFDQAGFLAAHARNTKLAVFLQQFRHSQMFEQFITERLQMAAEGFPPDDPFEQKVAVKAGRHGAPLGTKLADAVLSTQAKGKLGAMLRKTATMVKQSSSSLMAGIKAIGASHEQEQYLEQLQSGQRMPSAGSLHRPSPGVHRPSPASLHRPSPGVGAGSLGLHRPSPSALSVGRSGSSFGGGTGHGGSAAAAAMVGLRPSSSSGSLHRCSPVAHKQHGGGAAAVPLEDGRPELFFGDGDDDGDSVTSEGSAHEAAASSGRSVRGCPGPLEVGMGRNRSFSSLFGLSPRPPAVSPDPQGAATPAAPPRGGVGGAGEVPAPLMPAGKAGSPAAAARGTVNVAATAGMAAAQQLASLLLGSPGADAQQAVGSAPAQAAAPPSSAPSSEPTAAPTAADAPDPWVAFGFGSPIKTALPPAQQRTGWSPTFPDSYSPLASGALRSPTLRGSLQTIRSESSTEWAAFASASAAAESAAAELVHSPLAQGLAAQGLATQDIASQSMAALNLASQSLAAAGLSAAVRHRHTSSSGSSLQSKLSVGADAFSGLVLDAAAAVEQEMMQRTASNSDSASPRQQQQLPPPLEQQPEQAPARMLSAGDKSASWGDWATAPVWGESLVCGQGLPAIDEQAAAGSGSRHSVAAAVPPLLGS